MSSKKAINSFFLNLLNLNSGSKANVLFRNRTHPGYPRQYQKSRRARHSPLLIQFPKRAASPESLPAKVNTGKTHNFSLSSFRRNDSSRSYRTCSAKYLLTYFVNFTFSSSPSRSVLFLILLTQERK